MEEKITQAEDDQCVVKMTTFDGSIVYKAFSVKLADGWGLDKVFTGSYNECMDEIKKLNSNA